MWRGVWRPRKTPSPRVPLGARSVGSAKVSPPWEHDPGTIRWFNLYWGASGEVTFRADGKPVRIVAGSFQMHPPGTRIEGVPMRTSGAYRWCTLDGPVAEPLFNRLQIAPFRVYQTAPCPQPLFEQLEAEVGEIRPASEFRASATLYEIVLQAVRGRQKEKLATPLVARCRELMEQRFADPLLNVDALARALQVHRSRLSRLCREELGLPPSAYLKRLRLRHALYLLRHSELTVTEVARACGFEDPAYFSRTFAQAMGEAPSRTRNLL